MRAASGRAVAIAIAGALALAVAGCGSTTDRRNEPRPPSRIVLNGSISTARVSISPRRFGAGPVSLVVANLTDSSQQVTLEALDRSRPGVRQQTAPINPRDTAELRADLRSGRYTVHVTGNGIAAATLRVGKRRPSAQNDLLQP
ncbi:MAG: hypothetical protein QOH46_2114 [Solirubrobacteraceae bacterium]|nr:hypothetical protein [Solirubrobacteraceae bacterium]